MQPYRPSGTLVGLVTALFVITIVLNLVSSASNAAELSLLERAMNGQEITQSEAFANDARQGLIGLAQLGIFVTLVVLFLVWLNRASKNARALGAEMKFSPGWAVGYFFIPIVNLYRPYQAVAEIYRASDDPQADGSSWRNASAALIGWWWAAWLVMNFVGNVNFRVSWRAETIDELHTAATVAIMDEIVSIPAAILAVLVVRAIHRRQEAAAAKQMGGGASGSGESGFTLSPPESQFGQELSDMR